MHAVILGILHFYRQKSSRPDMEGGRHHPDAPRPELFQQLLREMQTRRRRRHRTFVFREDCLIIAAILFINGAQAADIGRQWYFPVCHQLFHELRTGGREGQRDFSTVEFFRNQSCKIIGEAYDITGFQLLGGFCKRVPAVGGNILVQCHFDLRAPPCAAKTGRNDFRVIEDEQVPLAQQSRQVGNRMVFQLLSDHQQLRRFPRNRRAIGDQFRRQGKIECVYFHDLKRKRTTWGSKPFVPKNTQNASRRPPRPSG